MFELQLFGLKELRKKLKNLRILTKTPDLTALVVFHLLWDVPACSRCFKVFHRLEKVRF
jgi:hypothetical protein